MIGIIAATAGCGGNPYAAVERMVPRRADVTARQFLLALQAGDLRWADTLVAADQRSAEERNALGPMVAMVGPHSPDTVRAINLQGFFGSQTQRLIITYELSYPDHWVLAQIAVVDSGGVARITEARTNVIPRSAASVNALTLTGKPPLHYLLVLIAIGLPLFMLVTMVQLARSGMPWRWLWVLISLLGTSRLSVNWTTGMTEFALLQVQLLGTGLIRQGGPYLPWILTISFPAGAVAAQFRMRHHRRRRLTAHEATAAEMPNDTIQGGSE